MKALFPGKPVLQEALDILMWVLVKNDGRTFTIALLGCGWPPHKTYKWSDARKLFQYGMDRYHYRDVYKEVILPDVLIKEGIPLSGGLNEPVMIACSMEEGEEKSLKLLLSDEEDPFPLRPAFQRNLWLPLRKKQVIGAVTYRLNGDTVKKIPVYLTEGTNRITTFWCMKEILSRYMDMPGILDFLTSS